MAHAGTPSPATAGAPLRMAEVLGALTLATDLANGQPSEHGLRTAILATRLAAGEPVAVRRDVFWTGLLRYLGCNSFAVEEAQFASGDDIGLRASFARTDLGRPSAFLAAVLRDVGRGAPPHQRLRGIARLLSDPGAPRAHALAQCDAGVHCARRLGMAEGVLLALSQCDERYDGRGLPLGLRGDAVTLPQRLVEVARVAVVYHGLAGLQGAVAELRRRAGGHLDPVLVERFADDAAGWCEGLAQPSVWDDYLAVEPGAWLVDAAGLPPLFQAFGLMADLKSGYFSGHSGGVARVARAAGALQGLAAPELALLEGAAWLHDLGRVAVPTGLWDKPGPLTTAEWERVHLHSYYTDRVLRRSPILQPYADIAGRAHERLDGSGYHRGERSPDPLARLLAAADVYQACTEPRPWRDALDAAAAAQVLRTESRAGRLCPRAVDAVLDVGGHAPAHAREPRGLSERELEVLRLLVLGLSNKEIARRLGLSPRTVQHHTIHIYGKAGVQSRAGAVLWAVDQGLLGRAR